MDNLRRIDAQKYRTTKRRVWGAAALFIGGYFILSFFFGEMGMLKSIKMKETYGHLRGEIESLQEENRKLAITIEALKSDPFYIEMIARDQLGLVREGEIIYGFYKP